MIKTTIPKIMIFSIALTVFASCSQILEPVELSGFSNDQIIELDGQENFEFVLKSLTLSEAKKTNKSPYTRSVMVTGAGEKANVFEENLLLVGNLPPNLNHKEYILGVGDELTFVQYLNMQGTDSLKSLGAILNKNDLTSDISDNLITTKGRIGSDGGILLLGLGKIKADGRTINDIRAEVRNILIRNGTTPNFQLEITDFKSRKAFVFRPDGGNGVLPITERPLSLKELVARVGYKSLPNTINMITIVRNGKTYRLSTKDLFDESRKEIYIQDKDQIKVETYIYKPGQVYALSGGLATIIPIDPSVRQTMADVMFVPGGPLSNQFAKRSEVYLLRGKKPITAYHLNAQNASKIIVAAAMELRPSDIIYVAERPIISFSRLLKEVTPLRLLLRDYQDGNIP
jgi:polysaccharide export outer membrane protein